MMVEINDKDFEKYERIYYVVYDGIFIYFFGLNYNFFIDYFIF
jgi:hypothetical protein